MGESRSPNRPQEDTVNDKILPYLKAYAALLGAITTALLGVYTSDTSVGKVLTVLSVIATAFATFQIPNIEVTTTTSEPEPDGHQGELDLS